MGNLEDHLHHALVASMVAGGSLRDPRWIGAFAQVPRSAFVPRFLTDPTRTGCYEPVDARDRCQHGRWLELIYADEPLIVQVENAVPVSSSTQPSLMADMLEALQVTAGHRVLEIGTGTGYNTAILCAGLGDSRVFSVDIDPGLVEAARTRLAALGYRPALAAIDGTGGYPEGAPFDRIIATCSLPRVPAEWIDQTVPGGLILVNLYRELGGGALALLTVGSRQASGRFMPFPGGFMPTRTIRRLPAVSMLPSRYDGTARPTTIGPAVLDDDAFGMIAALTIDAQRLVALPDGQPEQFWLLSADGAWAYVTGDPGGGHVTVQSSRTGLWDQVESAYGQWTAAGMPSRDACGLTVTPAGGIHVWLGTPDGPSWQL